MYIWWLSLMWTQFYLGGIEKGISMQFWRITKLNSFLRRYKSFVTFKFMMSLLLMPFKSKYSKLPYDLYQIHFFALFITHVLVRQITFWCLIAIHTCISDMYVKDEFSDKIVLLLFLHRFLSEFQVIALSSNKVKIALLHSLFSNRMMY